jgi:hypothetical protein
MPKSDTVILTVSVHDEDNPTPVEDTMTIEVYDTACLATIGEGAEYDPDDIDQDCDTDLSDFAEMAETWLDDYTLTEPVDKP